MDFFQAAKSARIQRAGLVPDAVCHAHSLTLIIMSHMIWNNFFRLTMHSVMRLWPFTWTALMPMPTSKMWCKLTIIMTIIVVKAKHCIMIIIIVLTQ